ncbi:hypothetical protein ACHAPE_010301 [Trichoderma viride]
MPRVSLDDVPLLLVRNICEHLAMLHRPSLCAFALVNKSCYNAAVALLFRHITLRIIRGSYPELSISQLRQILERTDSFRFVRHLALDGFGRWNEGYAQPNWNTVDEDGENVKPINMSRVAVNWQSRWDVDDDVWDLIADLIPDLPRLSDVTFACSTRFLPRLLHVLCQHHPRCRLHVDFFDLDGTNGSLTTHEHIEELITSPLLHTICLRDSSLEGYGTDGTPSYRADAVRRIITGLAPNLKKVTVLNTTPGWSPFLAEALAQERPIWSGFALSDNKADKRIKGSLEYLQLSSFEPLNDIRNWISCTNGFTLRVLKLEQLVSENALNYLATECRFPALETLVLSVAATNLSSPLPGSFWSAATSFLLSLPPLLALGLPGTANSSILRPILGYHGSSLRMLWLSGETASPELIEHLARNCPSIRKLGLQIRRSKGDATEITMYALLGSLPMLQDLSLTLDCSDTRVLAEQEWDDDPDAKLESPNDPSFDEFDQQIFMVKLDYNRYPRKGHVRDAFINCAVDGDLARSIFGAISSGKNKSTRPLLLSRLKINVIGGCNFGTNFRDSILCTVIDELSRSWIIERSPGKAGNGKEELEAYERTNKTQQQNPLHSNSLHPDVDEIFQRIWPKNGRKDLNWRKQWYSLPLANNMVIGASMQKLHVVANGLFEQSHLL